MTLLQFIIDVKVNDMDQYNQEIKELLEIIPIFEEEKDLLEIV